MADAETDAKRVSQKTLVADIDRTRAELARTIDAISDRVSPKKNVDRALGEVRQRASSARVWSMPATSASWSKRFASVSASAITCSVSWPGPNLSWCWHHRRWG